MAVGICACGSGAAVNRQSVSARLSDEEKHRLYSAALAASDSPLETATFRQVCQQIGIYDPAGKPNDQYLAFVSKHVDWATRSETDDFRREINSKEKALDYIRKHLSEADGS